jgi:hypothetical protein
MRDSGTRAAAPVTTLNDHESPRVQELDGSPRGFETGRLTTARQARDVPEFQPGTNLRTTPEGTREAEVGWTETTVLLHSGNADLRRDSNGRCLPVSIKLPYGP